MPLDRHFDHDFYRRSHWSEKFCWFPVRCDRSLQWQWLTVAYKGIQLITGPGEPVVLCRWLSKEEYIKFCLIK